MKVKMKSLEIKITPQYKVHIYQWIICIHIRKYPPYKLAAMPNKPINFRRPTLRFQVQDLLHAIKSAKFPLHRLFELIYTSRLDTDPSISLVHYRLLISANNCAIDSIRRMHRGPSDSMQLISCCNMNGGLLVIEIVSACIASCYLPFRSVYTTAAK